LRASQRVIDGARFAVHDQPEQASTIAEIRTNDMRALRLELSVATHFARRGHRLQWPEMVVGGTFICW